MLHRRLPTFLACLATALFGAFFFPKVTQAASCPVSTSITINQTYVNTNSCTSIDLTGTPTITWSGTVDLQGAGTVNVVSGTTTFSGALTLGSDDGFAVRTGAYVNHAAANATGIQVTAASSTIESGAIMFADGLGFGVFTGPGRGIQGSCSAGGAGHGGNGGNACGTNGIGGQGYGSSTEPLTLGSGGGYAGGTGGGIIKITVTGTLSVDGTLTSNGLGSSSSGGPGAGGSIWLTAATFVGAGTVRANGGSTAGSGGGGGGGRIALYYTTDSSTYTVTTNGGTSPATNGGAGTIFKKSAAQTYGELIIDNNNLSTALATSTLIIQPQTVDTLTIRKGGTLLIPTSTLSIASGDTITGSGTTRGQVLVGSLATISFPSVSTTVNTVDFTIDGTLNTATQLSVTNTTFIITSKNLTSLNVFSSAIYSNKGTAAITIGTINIYNGGTLTHQSNTNATTSVLYLNSSSTTIYTGGAIDVSAKGFGVDNGPGKGLGTGCSGGGAGYGGVGGSSCNGTTGAGGTYGSSTQPLDMGSGGATSSGTGGPGGGLARLNFTNLIFSGGVIRSNGGASIGAGGAGSGGSILITATSISGTGTITANGGTGPSAGGAGGGGRVSITYGSNTASLTTTAAAGTQACGTCTAPGAGTVYMTASNQSPNTPSSLGPTSFVNGSTSTNATPTLTFSISDPDVADQVLFRIQIDDSSDFSSPVVDYTSALGAQGSKSFTVGQVTGGGSYATGFAGQTLSNGAYYWRVLAGDLPGASSAYTTANSGSIAFYIDSTVRTISFTTGTQSGSESVTSPSILVQLSSPNFQNSTVQYSVTSGTATGGGVDYTLVSGTSTILAGQTTTSIPLTINDDSLYESSETLTITLSNASNSTIGAPSQLVYTITDNDAAPSVAFATGSLSQSESVTSTQISLIQSAVSGLSSQVTFAVTAGTAVGGGVDFTLATGTATIVAGQTTTSFPLVVIDDALYESSETLTITLSNATNASIGAPSQLVYTITDNDATPSIAFQQATLSRSESVTNSQIVLEQSAVSGLDSQITYAVTGGTAMGGGADFTLATGTATILAGQTTTSFPLVVIDDALNEADETIVVTLSSPVNATVGAPSQLTYTIQDNESVPDISFQAGSGSGSESVTNPVIVLEQSAVSGLDTQVVYEVTGGAAINGGVDFTLATGTATILAGQTTTSIPLTIVDDSLFEGDETVQISLTSSTNASIGATSQFTYTIQNNDTAPSVAFQSGSASGAESVAAPMIALTQSAVSGLSAQVTYAVTAGSAVGGGVDFTLATGTATILAGQTTTSIPLAITDDSLYESSETLTITLSNATNASIGAPSQFVYTITDNDTAPSIAFQQASISQAESITNPQIVLVQSAVSGLDAQVVYAITGGTATGGGADFTLTTGTATIVAGQTSTSIPLVIIDDALPEGNETLTIGLSNPTNATVGAPSQLTYTIQDNDAMPTVGFESSSLSATEGSGSLLVGFQLSSPSALDVSVSYSVSSGSARPNLDYAPFSGTAVIPSGQTATSVTLTLLDDAEVDGTKTIVIDAVAPVNATLGAASTLTVTISDDDVRGGVPAPPPPPPSPPAGGYDVLINEGAAEVLSPQVTLRFRYGSDVARMAISNTPDFAFISQEPVASTKEWNLCSRPNQPSVNCAEGTYSVYVKFYTSAGVQSPVIQASTRLRAAIAPAPGIETPVPSPISPPNPANPVSPSTPPTAPKPQLPTPVTVPKPIQKPTLPTTIPAGSKTFTRNLRVGSRGEDVRQLQRFLNANGFLLGRNAAHSKRLETGYFGPTTQAALRKFQNTYLLKEIQKSGLRQGNGLMGDITRSYLNRLMGDKQAMLELKQVDCATVLSPIWREFGLTLPPICRLARS